jgi:hypothetical protein
VSGEGKPGEWRILLDDVAPLLPPLTKQAKPTYKRAVLAQVAQDPTDEHFPLLIYDGQIFEDFTLTTRFKLVAGEKERMAGIAFRLQDENNYYYIRASGLGNTFNFFKVVRSQRSAPIGKSVEIPSGIWHELTIECRGSEIQAKLNGQEVFPKLNDLSFGSGKIAFWTKSDSVSYFTDTHIDYKPRQTLAEVMVQKALAKYDRLLALKLSVLSGPGSEPHILASDDPAEVGTPAWPEERQVIEKGQVYHLKKRGRVAVSLPLRDRNGEPVAAVRVVMKSFPGQTEKNAVARALAVVKSMESKVLSRQDLLPE